MKATARAMALASGGGGGDGGGDGEEGNEEDGGGATRLVTVHAAAMGWHAPRMTADLHRA